MTQATKHTIEELPTLRLPELQAYYADVLGESTRCPNKKFLIRRITETLAEQTERSTSTKGTSSQPETIPTSDEGTLEWTTERELLVEPETDTEPDQSTAPELSTALEATAEPEPAASELADEPAEPAEPGTATELETNGVPSTPDDTAASSATGNKPLTKLTVEELQQRYQDVVGRSTGSSHRRYLIWKIRQAEKGKVPVGPRKRRSPDEPGPEFKVLPLRMEAEMVERLDAARERLGLKNRMELFRNALNTYLAEHGESEVAALFAR